MNLSTGRMKSISWDFDLKIKTLGPSCYCNSLRKTCVISSSPLWFILSFLNCLQLPIGPPHIPPPTRYVKSMIFQHTLCKISYFEIHLEVVVFWTANHNLFFFSHKKCMIRFSVFSNMKFHCQCQWLIAFFLTLWKHSMLVVQLTTEVTPRAWRLFRSRAAYHLHLRKWKLEDCFGLILLIM